MFGNTSSHCALEKQHGQQQQQQGSSITSNTIK
jgi:hypothetical protein